MLHFHASHAVEQLAGEMQRRAVARRCVGIFVRVLLQELDQFRDGIDFEFRIDDQHIRHDDEQ
ncbi:hypothetical protein D3C72_2399620 [compost metagenome]